MPSPSQHHNHLGTGSVPQIQSGLGFRQALFDEQLTGEEVLPIAAVAAEHEEDMIDEALKMNYHQQRQQMMMNQGHQQQERGRTTSGQQQQSQREHRNGIQQRGSGSENSTVHIEIEAFSAESVGMVDPPTNGSAGTGSNGGGDDELLNMLAEMAEREETDRKNAEGGTAAGGNDGNAGGDRELK